MRDSRTRIAVDRRLNTLARAYVNIFRPEHFVGDMLEPEYSMSPRQAFDMISSSFRRNYVDEIGERASLRVLRAVSRPYLVQKYAIRTGLLSCIPVLVYAHGVLTATLAQSVLYLATRPLTWKNRGRGAGLAERFMRYRGDLEGRGAAVRRALRSELDHVPASALLSPRWREHLEPLLPTEEDVLEIGLKLADQYDGTIGELIETSRALAS